MAVPGTQSQEDRLKDLLGIPRGETRNAFGNGCHGGGVELAPGGSAVPVKRLASDMASLSASENQTPDPQALEFRLASKETATLQDENVDVEASEITQEVVEAETIVDAAAEKRKAKKKARIDKSLARNTGAVLHTIPLEALAPVQEKVTWDQDPELICSYNWQESSDGTNVVFVPGGPPKWTPPALPYKLQPDSGDHCTDLNYGRYPSRPYAPMFHAIESMKPNFKFNDVDVVAERNNLRTLLEFCQGKNFGGYRLDMHLVDQTLFLVKRQEKYWNRASAGQPSYGYNFEEHFTRAEPGLEDATNHYRVVQYPLGPLSVAVRFEADACYISPHEEEVPEPPVPDSQPKERQRYNQKAPIKAVQMGEDTPCSTIAELKTQSYKPEQCLSYSSYVDQVWFGRTTHLLTGVYDRQDGTVRRVAYKDTREMAANWEDHVQDALQKMVTLLGELRNFLTKMPGPVRAAVLVREERDGPLQIREMDFKHHIVEHAFYQRHWNRRAQPHLAPGSFNNTHPYGRALNDRGRGGRGSGRGSPYFSNQGTSSIPPGPPLLPPGWTMHYDTSSRRPYFVEEATARSQWEPPLPPPLPHYGQFLRRGGANNSRTVLDGRNTTSSGRGGYGGYGGRGNHRGGHGERDRAGRNFGDTDYDRQGHTSRGRGAG
ncbi:hypothetical protein BDV96DRAFT_585800 [Lophiotrema nucula]|uniref:WW domain-containing protein n=1 Tax=Lophiotrema nucula TaxID=690887 RepID=A0A6A5YQP7_9PLEO|nr:hypothetical protein BDV96DRAFT_585800 [Lophiotrema nucula]